MRGPKRKTNFFNFNKIRPLILVVMVASLFTYLVTINNTSTLGIEISQLETQIEDMQAQNNELRIQITNLRSISRVEQMAGQLNMVQVENYGYVGATSAFAAR